MTIRECVNLYENMMNIQGMDVEERRTRLAEMISEIARQVHDQGTADMASRIKALEQLCGDVLAFDQDHREIPEDLFRRLRAAADAKEDAGMEEPT